MEAAPCLGVHAEPRRTVLGDTSPWQRSGECAVSPAQRLGTRSLFPARRGLLAPWPLPGGLCSVFGAPRASAAQVVTCPPAGFLRGPALSACGPCGRRVSSGAHRCVLMTDVESGAWHTQTRPQAVPKHRVGVRGEVRAWGERPSPGAPLPRK